ncbi:MAG: ribosome recycling factor [Rhodospirillales bacterium]|nr:ribosome recycling factor [Rhodospirillales bacterium]
MDFEAIKKDIRRRMEGALEVLHTEFGGLRAGRASTSLLEPLQVEAYGQPMAMTQVGTVGVPEPRMLTVQVWDKGLVGAVEKAIRESDLGLNPSTDGQLVRIPIPPLSAERREEIVKIAGRYTEEAKVAVRNIRRHSLDEIKKTEKSGGISKDELRDYSDEIQVSTDEFVKSMDELLAKKEQEIMQV